MAEEERIERRKGYRTPAKALRKLASGHVLYEHAGRGGWDNFHVRNLGLAVAHRMGEHFKGDAEALREASVRKVARSLNASPDEWNEDEQRAFSDWSLLLAMLPDLSRWSDDEKSSLVETVRAKAGALETRYLRLLQQQSRLRREIIGLGSGR
jgi:hypothetical protein